MKGINVVEWYRRAALVYGMGIWTLIGCTVHYAFPELFVFRDGPNPDEVLPDHMEKKIYRYGNIVTAVYYRKDQGPPRNRLYDYLRTYGIDLEPKPKTKVDSEGFDE